MDTGTETERPPARLATRWVALIVGGEVVLSLLLGRIGLGRKPLWLDEGFTAMAASRGVSGAFDVIVHTDSNMPLYTVLLSVWRVLGAGVVTMRSLSVIAAAASVVAIYLLGQRLFDRTTGLVAGALLAVAPYAVRYSQELRGYSLLLLLTILASYCFVVAMEDQRERWFVFYALLGAACYAHLQALFVIGAQIVSLLFLGHRNVPWRRLAAAWVAIIVLLLPLAFLVSSAEDNDGYGTASLRSVPQVLRAVAGGSQILFVVFGALCVVPLIRVWQARRLGSWSVETWRPAFVLCGIAVPFLGVFGMALAADDNWAARYVIVILPMWLLAASVTISAIQDRRIMVVAVVALGALGAVRISDWYSGLQVDDWPAVVGYVAREGTAADGIVFCDSPLRPPFEYYALRTSTRGLPRPLSPDAPWGSGVHQTSARVATRSRDAPERIWVLRSPVLSSTNDVCDLETAMVGRERAVSRSVGGVIVERYDR